MKVSRRKFILSGLSIVAGLSLADALWVEKFFIERNEFYLGEATDKTDNIKVVQLSDLHLHSINYQLKRVAKLLNELQPDLILLTGDAIDKANNISLLHKFFGYIDNRINKVAILGNHEYWGNVNLNELKAMYAANNCRLLVNESIQYTIRNQTISITGIDDFVGGKADLGTALNSFRRSDHHIILNHCPQYNDTITSSIDRSIKVDFILSGHTHGGQINLFGFVPFLPQGSGKYLKGWYTKNGTKIYVSKGIGTTIFPVRFGARAELAIFNLTA